MIGYAQTLAPPPTTPTLQASPDTIALQRAYAKQLLAGSDQPIHSWSQGLAGIVDALVGGTMARKAGERESAGTKSANDQFIEMLTGGAGAAPASEVAAAPTSPPPDGGMWGGALDAIAPAASGPIGAAPAVSPPAAAGAPAHTPDPRAIAILNNPYATAAQKAMAAELLKPVLPDKPTDDMREYNLARQQGYGGSFRDYMIEQKQAGRSQVSIDQRGETAEAQERGKAVVGHFKMLAEDLPAADQLIQGADQLEALLQGVDTGSEAGLREWVRRTTGVPLGDNADKLQAISSLVDYMAPRMRVPGSGSSSDTDVAMFKSSLPSLMGTPGGNQLVIDTIRSMGEHRLAVAQISEDYLAGDLSSKEALDKMRSLPDPMADFKKAAPPAEAAPPATPAATPATPPPAGINPDEWNVMTPEERALFAAPVQGSAAPAAPPSAAPSVPGSVMFNPDTRPVYNGSPVIDLSPAPPRKYPPIPGPTGDPYLDNPMRVRRG